MLKYRSVHFLNELYKSLEKPYISKYGTFIQAIIFINIIVNLSVFSLGYLFDISHGSLYLLLKKIEYITVAIFIIELFLRFVSIGEDKKYRGIQGRIRYAFTFYIIIDILTILPYLLTGLHVNTMALKLLRFVRVFKLFRAKKILRIFFDIGAFAKANIFIQTSVLFLFSIFIIFIFHYAYSVANVSMMIFLDPPSLAEYQNYKELFFGIIELVLGLIVGGTLISIITETLANITASVKDGYYPYKGEGHIIIINENQKLEFILKELNSFYEIEEETQDVVIFLPLNDDIDYFRQNLNKYKFLTITITAGNELHWESYERIKINDAKKLILLTDAKAPNQNIKIAQYLCSHDKFNNAELDFTIEGESFQKSHEVFSYIFRNKNNKFTVVEHKQIVESFLNRSIVNIDYYQIYSTLVSAKDFNIYTYSCSKLFQRELPFQEAALHVENGVVIGIVKNDKLLLNPQNSIDIELNDLIVMILNKPNDYKIKALPVDRKKLSLSLNAPQLKEHKKICVVGDYADIEIDNITEFLTQESIDTLSHKVQANGDYYDVGMWEEILACNYDTIVLNLEDEYEFLLTLYLRNKFAKEKAFLQSIVNIMHNSVNAKLLHEEENFNNIILSEKLVGEYMTQVSMNNFADVVFQELTQSRGNEFYILTKEQYSAIFTLSIDELKYHLVEHGMIYVGVFKEDKFVAFPAQIEEIDSIVVMARGITKC